MRNFIHQNIKHISIIGLIVVLLGIGINGVYAKPLLTKFRQLVTLDKWVLTLKMDKIHVEQMASAGGAFSKELFLSFRSWAGFSGKGKLPVLQGVVDHGVQIGCGIDVSDGVTLGLSVSVSPTVGIIGNAGVTPSGTATVGGNTGGQLGANGGPNAALVLTPPALVGGNLGANGNVNGGVNGNVNGNVTPGVSFPLNVTPNANLTTTVTPSISAHIKPGVVNKISLIKKNLVLNGVIIDSHDTRLGLDGCLGEASVRAYTTLSISTAHEDSYINIYSDPVRF